MATGVVVIKHFFKARFSFAACPCQVPSAYPVDIGLGWKGLPRTNDLAYSASSSISKKFLTLTTGVSVMIFSSALLP